MIAKLPFFPLASLFPDPDQFPGLLIESPGAADFAAPLAGGNNEHDFTIWPIQNPAF